MIGHVAMHWVSLALLGGGVAPLEPVKDPCAKAAFHEAPATEREWLAVTFDVEDLRIRQKNASMRVIVRDAQWSEDALWASGRARWESGHAFADSLVIPWSEIESIDKPIGRKTGQGAGIGAFVGLGLGLGIAFGAEDDCAGAPGCGYGYVLLPLITVPAGAAIGALIGSTAHKWAPIFCAPSRSSEESPTRD